MHRSSCTFSNQLWDSLWWVLCVKDVFAITITLNVGYFCKGFLGGQRVPSCCWKTHHAGDKQKERQGSSTTIFSLVTSHLLLLYHLFLKNARVNGLPLIMQKVQPIREIGDLTT